MSDEDTGQTFAHTRVRWKEFDQLAKLGSRLVESASLNKDAGAQHPGRQLILRPRFGGNER
jgi:hypothetical protein